MTERRKLMEEAVNFDVLVLRQYCEQWLPAKEVMENTVFKTSQQIQDELSEIVDMSINDITFDLLKQGYKIAINPEGKPAWIMQYK